MLRDNNDNMLGANSANNQFDSSAVTSNPDGSILERLETIQGKLGAVDSTDNPIGANNADNGFVSSAVVANADGSLLERVEYLQSELGASVGASVSADIAAVKAETALIKAKTDLIPADPADASDVAAAFAVTDGLITNGIGEGYKISKQITYNGAVSYPAFTVSGLVLAKVIGYITTPLSNDAATTSVGTATSVAGLIAATAGTAMQTANQVWTDNTPTKFEAFPSTFSVIGDGEDIAVDGDANLAAGVVTLYCLWKPISADGNVVAA